MTTISITALPGIPPVSQHDNLADLLLAAIGAAGMTLETGDILVLAQKIVSKAEGRQVALSTVTPSAEARNLARICMKDPRIVELVLSETDEVVRAVPNVLIVRHRLGLVLANAGIDQSNVEGGSDAALLLPRDPDASAARIRRALSTATGRDIAVVIADSLGRAWRLGTCGVAIGASGVTALRVDTGRSDMFGRVLQGTEIGTADEIAAAASLAMGQADEATPAVLMRGGSRFLGEGRARDLVRPPEKDLFR